MAKLPRGKDPRFTMPDEIPDEAIDQLEKSLTDDAMPGSLALIYGEDRPDLIALIIYNEEAGRSMMHIMDRAEALVVAEQLTLAAMGGGEVNL